MVTKNAVFMRSVAFRKRLNKAIMKEAIVSLTCNRLFLEKEII